MIDKRQMMTDLLEVLKQYQGENGEHLNDIAQALSVILGSIMACATQENWPEILSAVGNNMIASAYNYLSAPPTKVLN